MKLAITLATFLVLVHGCMRSGGGGGGGTVPTEPTTVPPDTTTPDPCPETSDRVYLFVANDVTFVDGGYGNIAGTTCKTCSTGSEEYWDSSIETPIAGSYSAGSLSSSTCPNLCTCDAAGNCYTFASSTSSITYWPYCASGTCAMSGLLAGISDSDGLTSTSGGAGFAAGDQSDDLGNPLSVTDPSYPKLVSVSCSGCPITTCS